MFNAMMEIKCYLIHTVLVLCDSLASTIPMSFSKNSHIEVSGVGSNKYFQFMKFGLKVWLFYFFKLSIMSALEALLGAVVLNGNRQPVSVSSLIKEGKVIGEMNKL